MKRNTWRKSSDEVIIEIKDSPTREKNYWNLRKGKRGYSYSHGDNSGESLNNQVSIEISLNEGRTLTEEQKQSILETIIQGSQKEFEQGTGEDSLIKEPREKSGEGNEESSLVQRSERDPRYSSTSNSYSKWNTLLLLLIIVGVIALITTTGKL